MERQSGLRTFLVVLCGTALGIALVSPAQSQPRLTGITLFRTDGLGNYVAPLIWNTHGGDGAYNVWVTIGAAPDAAFVNGPDDASVSVDIPLIDGDNVFTFYAPPGIVESHFGIGVYLNHGEEVTCDPTIMTHCQPVPGRASISAYAPVDLSAADDPPFQENFSISVANFYDAGAEIAAGVLSAVAGGKAVTLTDYRLSSPSVENRDRVRPYATGADGTNDFIGTFVLRVGDPVMLSGLIAFGASSDGHAVRPFWNTLGLDGYANLWVRLCDEVVLSLGDPALCNFPAVAFSNGPADTSAALNMPLAERSYELVLRGDDVDPVEDHTGINVFFQNDSTAPRLSALVPFNSSLFTANGSSATLTLDGSPVAAANATEYQLGDKRISIEKFSFRPLSSIEPCVDDVTSDFENISGDDCPDSEGRLRLKVQHVLPLASPTPTPTITLTATPSPTASRTRSNTPSVTPSPSPSVTVTRTFTATRSPTPTMTNTRTKTVSNTPTPSGTLTSTATRTRTPSPTVTVPTRTPTPSVTSTVTPTGTQTQTPTQSRTASFTRTYSATPTSTATRTRTNTASNTPTPTGPPTLSPTPSVTRTQAATHASIPTSTSTPTRAASDTPTISVTLTSTATRTPTATVTLPTHTPTASATPSSTSTLTRTVKPTPNPSASGTSTYAATATPTPFPTGTWTGAASHTATPSVTLTDTVTRTSTRSATATMSPNPPPSVTHSVTITPTRTETATLTSIPLPTSSATRTPVASQTPVPSLSPSEIPTATPIPVAALRICDVAPGRQDENGDGDSFDAGEFGDGAITHLDVVALFRASLLPSERPPATSDLLETMDGAQEDLPPICGGDGRLANNDVVLCFRRSLVNSLPRYERRRDPNGCSSHSLTPATP